MQNEKILSITEVEIHKLYKLIDKAYPEDPVYVPGEDLLRLNYDVLKTLNQCCTITEATKLEKVLYAE